MQNGDLQSSFCSVDVQNFFLFTSFTLCCRFPDYFTHGGDKALDFHLEIGERCGDNCSVGQFDAIGQYSTLLFTSRAVEIVKEHDVASPLFLYLAYQAVHAPREAPDSYVDAYNGVIQDQDRKVFAGMLTCMDEGIGNLTAALDARGMLSNTFVLAPSTAFLQITLHASSCRSSLLMI